jgi:hypothetical protein
MDYLDHNRVQSLCHIYLGSGAYPPQLVEELAELCAMARREERDRLLAEVAAPALKAVGA